MEMADAMYYGGYRAAGYQYVCIDVSAPQHCRKETQTGLCNTKFLNVDLYIS